MASFKNELKVHLTTAQAHGSLSYAKRLKVGAVIVRDGRPIVTGRNGRLAGGSNECEDENGNTLPDVLHAELNCLLFAASEGIKVKGAIMVTTDSPCTGCAAAIIQAKLKGVYYANEYRDIKPLKLFKEYNVKAEKI